MERESRFTDDSRSIFGIPLASLDLKLFDDATYR